MATNMSYVTNIILVALSWGPNFLDEINVFFEEENQKGLVSVEDESLPHHWFGGYKGLECAIAIGAFNYLNLERFIDHITSLKELVINCQLIVMEQDNFQYRIIDIPETFRWGEDSETEKSQ